MPIPFYQIDAFTTQPFRGNPAVVCFLDHWPEPDYMQSIASENNLSETAFVVPNGDGYDLRWFTPSVEVELCGHATLAAAWALFEHEDHISATIRFATRWKGELVVDRYQDVLRMDLPLLEVEEVDEISLLDSFPQPVHACAQADKLILQLADEEAVRSVQPDAALVSTIHPVGVAVTAVSERPGVDFVSRFFAPRLGVPEDPVTGSLHCALADFWHERLRKTSFTAEQLSKRGGRLGVTIEEDRVVLTGQCRTVIKGEMLLDH